MIECTCDDPNLEFTMAKDMSSKLILIEAHCENCGRSAEGYGRSVEQALMEVRRNWKKGIRRYHKK